MYENLHNIDSPVGGFNSADYWSSSEVDEYHAWEQDFNVGSQNNGNRTSNDRVRAVRAFRSTAPTYLVSYDANWATGGTVPSDGYHYEPGDTVTVLGNTGSLVKTGYTFAGWNTEAGGEGTGYDPNVQHGLIAATADQSAGIQWYNRDYIATHASGLAIGTGQANTTTIVTAQGVGSYAAQLYNDLTEGGYDDWFLPSTYELNKLFNNQVAIGGFVYEYYWSSSELSAVFAWDRYFYYGSQGGGYKFNTYRVRAVRTF